MTDDPDNGASSTHQATDSNPPATQADGGNTDDRNLAVITHLSGIILWFIVPLVVWLVNKDQTDKAYLAKESREALNFQITVGIAYIVSWILMTVFIGFILWWLVWIFNLVFCIIAALQVSQNGSYRYPVGLRLIK